jgi:hypothetical protein
MTSFSIVRVPRRESALVVECTWQAKYKTLYFKLLKVSRAGQMSPGDPYPTEIEVFGPSYDEKQWELDLQTMFQSIRCSWLFGDKRWELCMQDLLFLKTRFWPPREGRRELQNEQEERGENIQRQIEHIQRLLAYFTMLWLKLYEILRFFCKFSEFPDRIRPPCTTMPWTIWPALVVLWGVCWMYRPPIGDRLLSDWDVTPLLNPGKRSFCNQHLLSMADIFNLDLNIYSMEYASLSHTTTPNDPAWGPYLATPEHHSQQNQLRQVPSQRSHVLENHGALSAYNSHLETPPLQGNTDGYPAISAIPSPAPITGAIEEIQGTHDNGQQRANLAGDSQYNSYAGDPMLPPAFGFAGQAERSIVQLGFATCKRNEEPQNTERKAVCTEVECGSLAIAMSSGSRFASTKPFLFNLLQKCQKTAEYSIANH